MKELHICAYCSIDNVPTQCTELLYTYNLTIIELAMWLAGRVCVWKSAPRTAYVTVTKIAGYVRVRILMNW